MKLDSKIYVAGHSGMVGSAIVRRLHQLGYKNIVTKTSKELNLIRQDEVEKFFEEERPEFVFLAAAKVGGIYANDTFPAEFIYNNLMIEANVIHNAYKYKVKKLLFLGSSCIYPKMAAQPIKEEYLLTGPLESTNEAYAMAKLSGIALCKFYRKQFGCNFISVMPTNLYGINDNFDLKTSHVLPALIRKFHEAKINGDQQVVIWGTGKPKREFLFVDDLADACVHLMKNYNNEMHVNVGTGKDLEIGKLANIIKDVVGYDGDIINDLTKPDGTPRKLLDVSLLKSTGWTSSTNLKEGIEKVYHWYVSQYHK
ncbi:GDP-L-fucose synthase [Bacillus dakarensis]|uniref:GDP-L-fucose synthase n=1 Tax=Robertmurraya dakarensis TaxID=1926278 RepID=UPI0009822E02|nr:GDP-L-fucose synthase [Bacillus dakarensis]